jgi:hypothetical protein
MERRSASTVLLSWSNSRSTDVIEASGFLQRMQRGKARAAHSRTEGGGPRQAPVAWVKVQVTLFLFFLV